MAVERDRSEQKIDGYAWVILGLVFAASVAAALTQFKVPPVITTLSTHWGISMPTAGWLMAVFSLVGTILALPSGLILGAIGLKRAALLALLCLVLGGVAGALTSSLVFLFLGRLIEGAGLCLMSIIAPTAIAHWFPEKKRGLPMGIWAAWVPLGCIIAYNVGPYLARNYGWTSLWWACAGFSAAMLVLVLLFFRLPAGGPKAAAGSAESEKARMLRVIKLRDPWLLGMAFGAINILVASVNTFMPHFLEHERGLSQSAAASVASLLMLVSGVAVILGGSLSDRLGTRKKLIFWPTLAMALSMLVFYLPGNGVIAMLLVVGFFSGIAVACIFAGGPELAPSHADAGMCMAVVSAGMNLGMFIGPAYYGKVAEHFGWPVAGYTTIPVLLLGLLLLWKIKLR